jgi:hypothetical protein
MTTIYVVHVEEAMENEVAVPTLGQARNIRRECSGGEGAITRVTVSDKLGKRDLACAMFNRTGYAVESVEIMPDKPVVRDE